MNGFSFEVNLHSKACFDHGFTVQDDEHYLIVEGCFIIYLLMEKLCLKVFVFRV